MPDYGVSLTYTLPWRGTRQPASNVWYYDGATFPVGEATVLLAEMLNIHRDLHSTSVEYVEGRVWTANGSPTENEMLLVQDLSSFDGRIAADNKWNAEFAFLVQWSAGTNVRGRPVYLRKWFHSLGAPPAAGAQLTEAELANRSPINPTCLEAVSDIAERFTTINLNPFGAYFMRAKSDRSPDGPAQCYRWVEHHQIGDQWRT